MKPEYKAIPHGTVTSPRGFLAGTTYAKIKTEGKNALDLGILYSEVPCIIAGAFTTNKIKAAPVVLCQERLERKRAQAIVVNSGCANACTGKQGLADSAEMADLTAKKLGISPEDVLVASTGVIGVPLPMKRLQTGIKKIFLSPEGGHHLAEAIMTTDTSPKEIAVIFKLNETEVTIGGVAKGAGMIHPNLATMLCFITTDAAIDAKFAQRVLQSAIDDTFNMITIDGDTSPNDTVLLLANGLASNSPLKASMDEAKIFRAVLRDVCLYLAKGIIRGGEGATKLIEVSVEGAFTLKDARIAARTIASSPLVKTAVHGNDPNWGRIIAALGRSGAEINPVKIDLYLKDICLLKAGCPVLFDNEKAKRVLTSDKVSFRIRLNLGKESATAWGCDLSEEYITINSAYVT